MAISKSLKELPFAFIFLTPWIVYAVVHRYLPARIPSHYSAGSKGWEADATMPPFSFLLVMTMVMLLLYGCMTLVPAVANKEITPSQVRFTYYFKMALLLFIASIPTYTLLTHAVDLPDLGDDHVMNITMLLLLAIVNVPTYVLFRMQRRSAKPALSTQNHTILWVTCHVVSSAGPLTAIMSSYGFQSGRLLPQLLLLFLIVCGNLLYNARPNLFIGIRTPWTLKSEEVWRKTHHASGIWLFASGIVGFIVSVFVAERLLMPVIMVVTIGACLFSVGYSFYVYKKLNADT